jgi:plasmid stabilization system protein ParE
MRRAAISFTGSAVRDLEEVRDWYAEQGARDVGIRLVEEIFQRVEALAEHPDSGRVVPEFDQPFLRELIHPPFRIVYRRDSRHVRIVRVLRSERLLHLSSDVERES